MLTSHKWIGKPAKICIIQDDFTKVEEIIDTEWMVEEDNFRKFLNGLNKAAV